jgi:hypothetical protein
MNKNNIILTIASYFLLVTLQMYIFFVAVGSKPLILWVKSNAFFSNSYSFLNRNFGGASCQTLLK